MSKAHRQGRHGRWTGAATLLLGAVAAVVALAGCGTAGATAQPGGAGAAATARAFGGVCARPEVVAAMRFAPLIDDAARDAAYPAPPGEPSVVARVNGVALPATELEMRTAIAIHQRAGQPTPPPGASGIVQSTDPAQVRHELLDKMIEDEVLRQEVARQQITVPESAARAEAEKQLATMQQWPATDPAYIWFAAYLCANSLTPATFASDPRMLAGYGKALAQSTLLQREVPPIVAPATATALGVGPGRSGYVAYVQQLRQAAHIEIYI